jgi:hypothetical protein
MFTMRTWLLALGVVAVFSSSAVVRADEYIVIERRAAEFDRWEDPFDPAFRPVTIISRETGMPVAVIEEQRTRTRLGYGGLLIANALAIETGRSFEEIVALKQSGMGWGRIAKEYGVKLGPIVSRMNRAHGAYRQARLKVKDRDGDGFVDEVKFKKAKVRGNGKAKRKFAKGFAKSGGSKGRGQGRGGGKK